MDVVYIEHFLQGTQAQLSLGTSRHNDTLAILMFVRE